MKTNRIITVGAAMALAVGLAGAPAQAQETTLNVITAGSENMVDYVKDYLAPMFEKQVSNVRVRTTGTGPGAAGSQKIFEKLKAQMDAGKDKWDVDVAVVHQGHAGILVKNGLLDNYRFDIATGELVTAADADNALGTDVKGYVIPMFHSQTAIAYNPALVSDPPKTYDELVAWAKANPKKFGYNGIKRGMSGQSFVVGWIYSYAGQAEKLMKGPYDANLKNTWGDALAKLKNFNQYVTFTAGNAGTLDMLNRGEISLGPVWVDMFYTWRDGGRLPPNMRLQLIGPGMPGQPMYYVIPAKAANKAAARKFVELATSPKVQAEGIVKNFNWYPGIDAKHVEAHLDQATWAKLFADVSPDDLASKGKVFPLKKYFDEIMEAYETQVAR